MKGGAKAIGGASADGQTWTIDGSAARAADLAVGRVMFMTSRAVGRVVRIDRRGPHLAVMLAPVRLTEVIEDADIRIDQDLAPGFALDQEGAQGALTVKELAAVEVPQFEACSVAQTPPAGGQQMPEARKLWNKGESRAVRGRAIPEYGHEGQHAGQPRGGQDCRRHKLEVRDERTLWQPRVKFGADVSLYGQQLTVHAVMPISNGTMGPGTTFLINGIERMDVGLLGGVENGTSDNFKVRVEVPIEVDGAHSARSHRGRAAGDALQDEVPRRVRVLGQDLPSPRTPSTASRDRLASRLARSWSRLLALSNR